MSDRLAALAWCPPRPSPHDGIGGAAHPRAAHVKNNSQVRKGAVVKTRQRITLAATVAAAIAGVLTPSASATPLSATLAYGGTAPACIVRSLTQLRHERNAQARGMAQLHDSRGQVRQDRRVLIPITVLPSEASIVVEGAPDRQDAAF